LNAVREAAGRESLTVSEFVRLALRDKLDELSSRERAEEDRTIA
jgi:hypothetical protein